jgi:hypothetical protein
MNDWLHLGTQGWAFQSLSPEKLVESPAVPFHIHSKLQKDVWLTYQALLFLREAVRGMYKLDTLPQLDPHPVEWLDEEYRDMVLVNMTVWKAR